jgi:hypothetical protein
MASSDAPSSFRENQAVKDAPRHDTQLEAGIEDSFPASDPPAVTQPASPPKDARAAAEDGAITDDGEPTGAEAQQCLDESLEDSFPASDPPSITQPPGEGVGAPARPKPKEDGPHVAAFLKPKS